MLSKQGVLGGAIAAILIGSALNGCQARTTLADVTDEGDDAQAGAPSPPSGGTSSAGAGPSGGTGPGNGGAGGSGTAGTASGGNSSAGTGAGTGGEKCWDPTVDNFCRYEWCPDTTSPDYSLPQVIEHYEESGVCDESTVWLDQESCGGEIVRYEGDGSAGSFLYISGTLGATAITRDAPFGPCNLTHYYGGIELDEYFEMYDCSVVARCVACGPSSPDPQFPPCRFDCPSCLDFVGVMPDADACSDPDSCECYCQKASPTPN